MPQTLCSPTLVALAFLSLALCGCADDAPDFEALRVDAAPWDTDARPGPDASPLSCAERSPLTIGQCLDGATGQPCLDFASKERSWPSLAEQSLIRPIIGLQGSPMFVMSVRGAGIDPGTDFSDGPDVSIELTQDGEFVGSYATRPAVIAAPDASGDVIAPQLYVVAFLADQMAGQEVQVVAQVTDRSAAQWCSEAFFEIGQVIEAPPLP